MKATDSIHRISRSLLRRTVSGLDRLGIPHPIPRDLWLARTHQVRQSMRRGKFHRALDRIREQPVDLQYQRILFPTLLGWGPLLPFYEYPLANALRLRGADVQVLICDGLPHCQFSTYKQPSRPHCGGCHGEGVRLLDAFNLKHVDVGKLVSRETREAIEAAVGELSDSQRKDFHWLDLPIGRYIRGYLPNYFHALHVDKFPEAADVERRSLVASAILAVAADKLLKEQHFDKIVVQNGSLLMSSSIWGVARRHGVAVDTMEFLTRDGTISLRHEACASQGELGDDWIEVADKPLTVTQEQRLSEYLSDRENSVGNDYDYNRGYESDIEEVRNRLGVQPNRPTVVLFTNVTWDSAVLGRDSAFPGVAAWVFRTIREFEKRPHLNLVIRVHPAELLTATSDAMAEQIKQEFSTLPPNVRLVPPDEPLRSYAIMSLADVALVYASTAGLDMALRRKPVVVAGEVHYKDKGFTIDIESIDDYVKALDSIPDMSLMPEEQHEIARRYAYARFFRLMIPFRAATRNIGGEPAAFFHLKNTRELEAGQDPNLDAICDGILHGSRFLAPDPDVTE